MLFPLAALAQPTNFLTQPIEGTVLDNMDPLELGRIKVDLPPFITGAKEDLPWCTYRAPATLGGSAETGMFMVPNIGTSVTVEHLKNDPHFPFYTGLWYDATDKIADFAVDYPATYGFRDEAGNIWYVNRTSKEFKFTHQTGASFLFTSEGHIKFQDKSGAHFELDATAKKIILDQAQGIIELGRGASEQAILGNTFMTFLNTFLTTEFLLHTHNCAVGPTTPVIGPATLMSMAQLSDIVKLNKA